MGLLASDYDKSKYWRAEDLQQEKKFRIKATTEEVLEKDGKAEKKLVVWFTNDERGLVLNKTNNRTIRAAYGDDTANWVGKIIVVFPTMTDVRGKMTPALRVRILPPKQTTAAPQRTVTAGNGAAVSLAAAPVVAAAPLATAAVDPELEPDPVKPIREELDDEVPW